MGLFQIYFRFNSLEDVIFGQGVLKIYVLKGGVRGVEDGINLTFYEIGKS